MRFALFVVSAALAVAGCNKTVNTDKGEDLIEKLILDKMGAKASVACPGDVKAKKGDTFICKATFDGDVVARVEVTQTNDEGGVTFELLDGLVLSQPLEEQIAANLKEAGIEATAACGERVRLSKPDSTFTCDVTASEGPKTVFVVTVTDGEGNVTWKRQE